MRILDENNIEILNPNLTLGHLINDKIFIAHHEAIEPIEEVWHYETIAEYPNGGKDIAKVIDIPAVEAKEAWDEYEDIQRYIVYTEDELKNIQESNLKNTPISQFDLQTIEAKLTAILNYQGLNLIQTDDGTYKVVKAYVE